MQAGSESDSPPQRRFDKVLPLDKILLLIVAGLLLWFFASSLLIAFDKSLQHDDAMFATIPKNFLNGYGWATSYGEKIPFNPDISTGPSLLLPAALMITAFGNEPWIPAITGALTNIVLVLLIVWQLWQLSRYRAATLFALLLSISLFAVNDFKTFTGYYTGALLFLFAVLYALNPRYRPTRRFLVFGCLTAIGLYAKPLILLSFLAATPFLLWRVYHEHDRKQGLTQAGKAFALLIIGFALVFMPWQWIKQQSLADYDPAWQQAYNDYGAFFFAYHGSGVGQFRDASDKIEHLKHNSRKNFRISKKFIELENNYPLIILLLVLASSVLLVIKQFRDTKSIDTEAFFAFILSAVIVANFAWFIVISFAMTPGHTFFAVLFSFFLLFYLIASYSRTNLVGITLCVFVSLMFAVRHAPMLDAYSFHVDDYVIDNKQLKDTVNFIEANEFRYPIASCGYSAASHRLEFLLSESGNFVDCYNLFEDNLQLDEQAYKVNNPQLDLAAAGISAREHFFTSGQHWEVEATFVWQQEQNLTFAVELPGYMGALRSQDYILGPLSKSCLQNILFRTENIYVCEVLFDDVRDQLDPTKTARHLVDYQHWYRTRIITY